MNCWRRDALLLLWLCCEVSSCCVGCLGWVVSGAQESAVFNSSCAVPSRAIAWRVLHCTVDRGCGVATHTARHGTRRGNAVLLCWWWCWSDAYCCVFAGMHEKLLAKKSATLLCSFLFSSFAKTHFSKFCKIRYSPPFLFTPNVRVLECIFRLHVIIYIIFVWRQVKQLTILDRVGVDASKHSRVIAV